MKTHPVADCFEMMPDAEVRALVADIKAHGLRHKIITADGMILDGRNRFKACEIAGVTPEFEEYAGSDPVAFVISCNDRRRHSTPSQRAMAAAKLANLPQGRRPAKASREAFADGHTQNGPRGPFNPPTQEEAAESLNVSRGSVQRAAKVLHDAEPAIADAVRDGRLSVKTAAKVADAPKLVQRRIARNEAPEKAAKQALRELPKDPDAPPWAEFLSEVEACKSDARKLSAKLSALLKFENKRPTNKWAHFMSHDGTVGAILAIVRYLDDYAPAAASDKPPGYIPGHSAELRKRQEAGK